MLNSLNTSIPIPSLSKIFSYPVIIFRFALLGMSVRACYMCGLFIICKCNVGFVCVHVRVRALVC